ncbi:putative metal-binding motif-containing protein [Nanoarchaeota archaeon]
MRLIKLLFIGIVVLFILGCSGKVYKEFPPCESENINDCIMQCNDCHVCCTEFVKNTLPNTCVVRTVEECQELNYFITDLNYKACNDYCSYCGDGICNHNKESYKGLNQCDDCSYADEVYGTCGDVSYGPEKDNCIYDFALNAPIDDPMNCDVDFGNYWICYQITDDFLKQNCIIDFAVKYGCEDLCDYSYLDYEYVDVCINSFIQEEGIDGIYYLSGEYPMIEPNENDHFDVVTKYKGNGHDSGAIVKNHPTANDFVGETIRYCDGWMQFFFGENDYEAGGIAHGECNEGDTQSCGVGSCYEKSSQTCVDGQWGECNSPVNTDCGICCKCVQGSPTYDEYQNQDCADTICPDDGCGKGGCGTNIFGNYLDVAVSNECIGLFDCTQNTCNVECEDDTDNDGFSISCEDCDDTNYKVNPMALELCDDEDNNCDGEVDTNCIDCVYYYCELFSKKILLKSSSSYLLFEMQVNV